MATTNRRHLALLRGVNVGGRNRLPMATLAAMFAAEGCDEVGTYIQSGNVVFRASAALARRIPKAVQAAIAAQCDFDVPVLVRSAAAWQKLVAANPFLRQGVPENELHVLCLAERPTRARVAALDADRSPSDRFIATGTEIYLHLPNGVARTKLTNDYFDRALRTRSTARNWRTATKLLELLTASAG